MLRLLVLFCLATTPALANPGYYRVTGVAADDRLNVRAAPEAGSADIGDLPHDAAGIEVIDTRDGWGRIVWQEGNGWLSMRFLAPDPLPTIADTALPVGLVCSGTEPFWSIRLSGEGAVFSDISGATYAMPLRDARVADGRLAFPVALRFGTDAASGLSIIAPGMCNDGMSDRVYGYNMVQLLRSPAGERFLTGCCQLPLEIGAH